MEIEYGKLIKLLQKTFMNAFVPDDKSSLEELTFYVIEDIHGEYAFDLENLLATKDEQLKAYFKSLLPQRIIDDENERRTIIESYKDPANIIDYGLPQVCLEDFFDSQFRRKLEEKNEFFKALSKNNPKRYYIDFNLVPPFLEKASRMWSIEYEHKKNKLVPKKFVWRGYEEFTSREQVIGKQEKKK